MVLEGSQTDPLMETADAWHCMAWHTAHDNPRTRDVVGNLYPALRPTCRIIGLEPGEGLRLAWQSMKVREH